MALDDLRGPLELLREAGALVAIDDAGAGYAGLQAIAELRPQLVKVDRSLVSGMGDDPVKSSVVRMLGDLAGRLDAWLLVEGVEEVDELEAAARLGVPLGQGYLLGRPSPVFVELDNDLRDRIRWGALQRSDRSTVRSLVQAADLLFADEPAVAEPAVRVDGNRRPLAVLDHGTWRADPLTIQANESIQALAARLAAMDPMPPVVVVVRPAGGVLGVVATSAVFGAVLDMVPVGAAD